MAMKNFFGNSKIKTTYQTKSQLLTIKGLNTEMVGFLKVVGGKNVKKSTRASVVIDVASVKDVETALGMISIVTEVKKS